jgi:hypothetical protein
MRFALDATVRDHHPDDVSPHVSAPYHADSFSPYLGSEEIGRESAAFTHSVLVGLPLVVYVLT